MAAIVKMMWLQAALLATHCSALYEAVAEEVLNETNITGQQVYLEAATAVFSVIAETCSEVLPSYDVARSTCDAIDTCYTLASDCVGSQWRYCNTTTEELHSLGNLSGASGLAMCTKTKMKAPPGVMAAFRTGPRLSNDALTLCVPEIHGTLLEAKYACSVDPYCTAVFDWGCNGKHWRTCETRMTELLAAGDDLEACSMMKAPAISVTPEYPTILPGHSFASAALNIHHSDMIQLWVQIDDQPEQALECSTGYIHKGVEWLRPPPHEYLFRTYAVSRCDLNESSRILTTPTAQIYVRARASCTGSVAGGRIDAMYQCDELEKDTCHKHFTYTGLPGQFAQCGMTDTQCATLGPLCFFNTTVTTTIVVKIPDKSNKYYFEEEPENSNSYADTANRLVSRIVGEAEIFVLDFEVIRKSTGDNWYGGFTIGNGECGEQGMVLGADVQWRHHKPRGTYSACHTFEAFMTIKSGSVTEMYVYYVYETGIEFAPGYKTGSKTSNGATGLRQLSLKDNDGKIINMLKHMKFSVDHMAEYTKKVKVQCYEDNSFADDKLMVTFYMARFDNGKPGDSNTYPPLLLSEQPDKDVLETDNTFTVWQHRDAMSKITVGHIR